MRTCAVFLTASIALSGCANTNERVSRSLASGSVGCPADEVVIENETASGNIHNFTAVCKGARFSCTYLYPNPISCKEQR